MVTLSHKGGSSETGSPLQICTSRTRKLLVLFLYSSSIYPSKSFPSVNVRRRSPWARFKCHKSTSPCDHESMELIQSEPRNARKLKNGPTEDLFCRREALLSTAALLTSGLAVASSNADEGTDDLTSALFNLDGSLKEGIESQAKFQKVEFVWDASPSSLDSYLVNVDGSDITAERALRSNAIAEAKVKISYDLPVKWNSPSAIGDAKNQNDLYKDLTVQQDDGKAVHALTSIIVYQSPGLVEEDRLEKASSVGIAKALNVLPSLSPLQSADLVSGRVRPLGGNNNQKVFDFDLAVAPKNCANTKDNLGLGFCPFDTIYLLSGAIVNQRLYVFALQCNKDQWKRSNSDLRKVRSSFYVEQIAV